jgi:UDP-N-acetylmuramoyl-tripeptide--D-alanyl-D-alanine ligase
MKILLKIFLKTYLKIVVKIVLLIHRPFIIAIAGSTNKSFTKERISKNLRAKGYIVRSNIKSFNTDVGLPLAILALPSGYGIIKDWLPVIFKAPLEIFNRNFPKILVLELGVSCPGDMKYLLSIIQPNIAVLTNLTQRYLESFGDMDELADEYEYLIKKVDNYNGLLLYNSDNSRLCLLTENLPRAESFGFNLASDCRIMAVDARQNQQNVKLQYQNELSEIAVNRPGVHHIYALATSVIIIANISKIIK